MKNITFISVLLSLMTTFSVIAQDFQGKAYYISKSNVDMDFGGRQISEERKARMKEMLKKQSTKNHVLQFDKNSSLFSELETVGQNLQPTSPRGGRRMAMFMGQSTGIYYKNSATRELIAQRDIYGKQFLIKDSLQSFDWQLGDEVKTIGKYTCFKAITTVPVPRRPPKDGNQKENDTMEVTAWYTVEIPVSHGPELFWGLPGLILELKTENRVLLCSKIELDAGEAIALLPPKKGKKVTQEEFDELFAKKTKEVWERFGNRRPGGGRRN